MAMLQQKQMARGLSVKQAGPVVRNRAALQCTAFFGKKASAAVAEKPTKSASKTTSSKTTKQM
jgi:hypothetical protein